MTDEDKMYEEQMEIEISEYKQMLRKISQTCQVILFHQGMGETCVFAMLMHAYKQEIKKPLVILALKESRLQILQACPDIDEIILCGEEIYEKIRSDQELRITCQIMDFSELHFWSKGRGYRGFKEEICAYLELPFDTEYVKYNISSGNTMKVKEHFDSFKLKEGRTVFIVPSTICYGDQVVSKEYWKKLTVKIKESGRDVFFNAETPFIEGEKHGFLICKALPDFVRFCGNVVGARTGLLDFLATFTDVRIQAIYPNEYCNCWTDNPAFRDSPMSHKEMAESHLQSMNMARMLGAEHTIEFMHHNEDEEIERIIENLQ